MTEILADFLKLFFQPPVMILFCLAVAGLCVMLRDRSERRERVNTEWRVRETLYRKDIGLNDDLIARARRQFYQRHHLKEPK